MKKNFMPFSACLSMTCAASDETISLWRAPVPVLKAGKYSSIILDRGELTKAVRDSRGEYIFTEKGAGVKPLVLIGTPVQIIEFFKRNESAGIESYIKELPDIYTGITKYSPTERFSGLFPFHDIFIRAVESVQRFLPFGDDFTDVGGIPSDLQELYQKIHEMDDQSKSQDEVLYVKFSYLPEEGMTKIGSKTISFGKILKIFENQ